jgi:hypothetical protein
MSSCDLVVTRGASRFRVQETRYGVGNLISGDRKHGRRIGRAATVSRFALGGIAGDDRAATEGTVARRIGGAVEANDGRAERGGEMQRAGVR